MAAKKETEVKADVNDVKSNDKEPVTASVSDPVTPSSTDVKVKIKLFKDNDKYKDDVVVGVNGKLYQIKRGVEVEVPLCVAEIINNSIRQDEETARKIAEAVEKYKRKSEKI